MEKFLNEIAEILEVPVSEISMDSVLAEFNSWDSLAHIVFITLLDNEYSKRIKASDVRNAVTINDLFQFSIS